MSRPERGAIVVAPTVDGSAPRPPAPGWPARAAAAEAAVWTSLAQWLFRRPLAAPGRTPVPYAGAAAPPIWVFIGISAFEIPILHLLVPAGPWRWAALALGVWGLVWMLGFLATAWRRPHLVDDRGVLLRCGSTIAFQVPWDAVESVARKRTTLSGTRTLVVSPDPPHPSDAAGAPATAVLHVAVAGGTNLEVALVAPVAVEVPRTGVVLLRAVHCWADDPTVFLAATRAALAARDARERPDDSAVAP